MRLNNFQKNFRSGEWNQDGQFLAYKHYQSFVRNKSSCELGNLFDLPMDYSEKTSNFMYKEFFTCH